MAALLLLGGCYVSRRVWGPSAYADRPAACHDGCRVVLANGDSVPLELSFFTTQTNWRVLGTVPAQRIDSFTVLMSHMPGVLVARRPPIGEVVDCTYDGPRTATRVRLTCGPGAPAARAEGVRHGMMPAGPAGSAGPSRR